MSLGEQEQHLVFYFECILILKTTVCHVEGEGSDTSLVALVHYGGAWWRYGRSMCSWPMYSWMRAVMHEKRFALHGHKSTDGLNVEEEIGETTVVGIYVCTI